MKKAIIFTLFLVTWQVNNGFGNNLVEGLSAVLETHPDLVSARAEYGATEDRRDGKFRDSWLPNIDLSYKYGPQHYNPADGDASDETAQEFSARVEQLLMDFGETSSQIAADTSSIEQKKAQLEVVQEELLMAGLNGFIQVQKAQKLVGFADLSVENILQQTKMENMLVEKGKGYSSNVLQAKTQLAGAYARQNQANADLDVALAEVDAVFKTGAALLNYDEQLSVPQTVLPTSLNEAIDIALAENPVIKVGSFRSKTLKEKILYERARGFYPNLSVVGEVNRDNDLDGNIGTKRDDRLMLELSYPINFGLSGLKHGAAAKKELFASEKAEQSVLRDIEKSVRVAWRNHQTAQENIILLENKVNIAGEFLRLARKERKAGRRTLLEVLAAETTLVNSQSELASASADLLLSAYSLIYTMGRLDLNLIAGTVNSLSQENHSTQAPKNYAGMEGIPAIGAQASNEKSGAAAKKQSEDIVAASSTVVGVEPERDTKIPAEPSLATVKDYKEPKVTDDAESHISLFNLTVSNKGSSFELVDGEKKELEKFVERLQGLPGVTVEIYGYTSSKTNSKANIRLSQQRADLVKGILVDFGVDKNALVALGRGNENPIATNDTTEGRRENRRVELFVYGNKALLEKI